MSASFFFYFSCQLSFVCAHTICPFPLFISTDRGRDFAKGAARVCYEKQRDLEMKENSSKGGIGKLRLLWNLRRTTKQFGLPELIGFCLLFFLLGFFGSRVLFSPNSSSSQDLSEKYVSKRMAMGEMEEGGDLVGLPHGITGETRPSAVSFQVLSWKPRALYFPKFATPEQCQQFVKVAKRNLRPSSLALRKGETAESTKGIRTSSGTFISAWVDNSGILNEIDEKIARVTMIPKENGEAYNVLRYEIGQRYASHYDSFNPDEYGPQKSQRVASFLLYLTDVEEGGETMFPFENGLNMDNKYDYEKCIGLKVKPRQGDGLLFYSLHVNGTTIDPTSLHGSCPVIKGEKWVATKWLRNQN